MPKNSVPIEKPTVAHPIGTISAPDGTRRLITASQDSTVLNKIGKGCMLARSRSHRCKRKSTTRTVCIVQLQVTVNNIIIFSVAQK
jgi:hypothetical protein